MTANEIYRTIGWEATPENKNAKFVFIGQGNGNYVYAEIVKRSQITIDDNVVIFKTKFSTATKPLDKILNVFTLKQCIFR